MEQNTQETELRLAINAESFQSIFADAVQMEASLESVKLHFIQRLPGNPPEGQNAVPVASIVVTWAHFNRMIELFLKTSAQNKGAVIDFLQTSFESNR